MRVEGVGFRLQGLGFGVLGLGFGVWGLGFGFQGLGIKVQGSESIFEISGFGLRPLSGIMRPSFGMEMRVMLHRMVVTCHTRQSQESLTTVTVHGSQRESSKGVSI